MVPNWEIIVVKKYGIFKQNRLFSKNLLNVVSEKLVYYLKIQKLSVFERFA